MYMMPSTTSGVASNFSSELRLRNPLQIQVRDIRLRNLIERAVVRAVQIAVISKPVLRFAGRAGHPVERHLRLRGCGYQNRYRCEFHFAEASLDAARKPARYATRSCRSPEESFPLNDGIGEVRTISNFESSAFINVRRCPFRSRI